MAAGALCVGINRCLTRRDQFVVESLTNDGTDRRAGLWTGFCILAQFVGMLVFMTNLTQVLSQIESGHASAADQLLPIVYDELRRLAASKLAQEKHGQTLQATALVHEAYLRLLGADLDQKWDGRGHFFAAAAEAMRRILVDRARRKLTRKHGGDHNRVEFTEDVVSLDASEDGELLALNEALELLEQQDSTKAELVKLRYFGGLTGAQAAEILEIGVSTADKYWAYAKVWLRSEMKRIINESG